jgi:hypothetical protein
MDSGEIEHAEGSGRNAGHQVSPDRSSDVASILVMIEFIKCI